MTYTPDGRRYTIWGYTAYATRYIFVRNDVLGDDGEPNPRWATVFAHEMGHALEASFAERGGVEDSEKLAREFTRSLGLGE